MFDAIGTAALFVNGRMWPYPYRALKSIWLTEKEKEENCHYYQNTWLLNRNSVKEELPNHHVAIKTVQIDGIPSQAVYMESEYNVQNSPLIVYSPGNCYRINGSLEFAKEIQKYITTGIHFSLADYSMYLAQRRLKNRSISQEDTAAYFKELARRAFEETPNNNPLVFICVSGGGVGELHGLADYLDEKKNQNDGELPADIQAKVNKMKVITSNVPSKAEHQGDAFLYPTLRSFYARFLFSKKFREFNTATACKRILSHIKTNDSKNLLIMQVDDDPVVSSELQLFNKVEPLIESSRKDGKDLINRVMFKVEHKFVEYQNGTSGWTDEAVHHNVEWKHMKLWNKKHNEARNPYNVIHDFVCENKVPDQKQHGKSEQAHRKDDGVKEKGRVSRVSETIAIGIFNLIFFLFFLPVIPGGYLVNLLNKYNALQNKHPKRATLLAILFTLAVIGLIVANIFMPFAPLIPLITWLSIAWLVSGPFDVLTNWLNKKIRHANIDVGILQRILRIAFVLYNLCIAAVSFLCAAVGEIISRVVLSLFVPDFIEEYLKLHCDIFMKGFEGNHKGRWLSSELAKVVFTATFYILILPLMPFFHIFSWIDKYEKSKYARNKKIKNLFKVLSVLFTLAAIGLIVANIVMPFAPLAPLVIGLIAGWLFGGPFDVLLGNWLAEKIIRLRSFLRRGLLHGVLGLVSAGAMKISSLIAIIGTVIGSPFLAVAKFMAAHPVLRYTVTGLLLGLAVAAPFLAPLIWPALALGLTIIPMKIALGFSYATALLPPLFPDKLWQACKRHKYIAIAMVLLLAISIALPFSGIGIGALFGAALLSKLAASIILAASSILISWMGLKIADCSPCCRIGDEKEVSEKSPKNAHKNSHSEINNGLGYNSHHYDDRKDSSDGVYNKDNKSHIHQNQTYQSLLGKDSDGDDNDTDDSSGYNYRQ